MTKKTEKESSFSTNCIYQYKYDQYTYQYLKILKHNLYIFAISHMFVTL